MGEINKENTSSTVRFDTSDRSTVQDDFSELDKDIRKLYKSSKYNHKDIIRLKRRIEAGNTEIYRIIQDTHKDMDFITNTVYDTDKKTNAKIQKLYKFIYCISGFCIAQLIAISTLLYLFLK